MTRNAWIRIDTLALVNDSVICLRGLGPLYAWSREYLPQLLKESLGIIYPNSFAWGITKSYETDIHLQSFFLEVVGEIASKSLLEFVNERGLQNFQGKSKKKLITDLEIGLSQYLLKKHRIPLCAPYDSYFLAKKIPQRMAQFLLPGSKIGANPAYSMWDRMLILGCPVVKKKRHTYEGDETIIDGLRGTASSIPRQ
jgi:hypothetical protein